MWNSFCLYGNVLLSSAVVYYALSSDYKTDKISSPKFDFLEFTFYRKIYLNFKISEENSSETRPYFFQSTFLCIHNCDSLGKGAERSLACRVGLKDQKDKEKKTETVVQITRGGATAFACITEAYCELSLPSRN